MKILNLMPFCKAGRDIGIAIEGTFAASAWRISDEAFNAVRGDKFSWFAPDGGSYTDSRSIFERPTEAQVIKGMSERIKEIAVEQGLMVLETVPENK